MGSERVAYFINQYPKVSHSFIRREIQALERLGVGVDRYALRGWDAEVADADDDAERAKTRYVLRGGAAGLLLAVLRNLFAHPARWCRALWLAVRMASGSERSLPYHLVYFAEACVLAAWMDEGGAQHLHAHFGTNSAEVAMLAAMLSGRTYSVTVHGPEEFDKPRAIGLAEKARRSAFIVAVSSYGRSQLYRWLDAADWDKVQVVHCGIEQSFHDVPVVPLPERPRLVCVGRLCEQKGQLLLLRAASLLQRKGVDFELVLAGDGEMRATIESEIAALGLSDKVSITGWISSARVREELLASRALVLPSFAEGLPVVIMEAMALRRPVLSTYIAGIPELVLEGETGWLFPAGAMTELAAAMEAAVAAPPAQLVGMGENARRRVLERHDIDHEAEKMLVHFRHAIHRHSPELARQAWSTHFN